MKPRSIAILNDTFDTLRTLPSFSLLHGHDVAVYHDDESDIDALAERLAGVEVLILIRERTVMTAELVDRLPDLRLISGRSSYRHIDIEACTRNGVLVCSKQPAGTPSYAAAELTWGLILASMRQIPQQMASLQQGEWQIGVGKTLQGRTLGLYGYGRIGKTVAGYGEAFGMNVVWWSSDAGRARALADGQQVAANREAFFAESDVVSVHVRLNPTTTGLVTAADLALMDPSALFVNTSRAAIVEPGALEVALDAGRPGYAAVDVFSTEPITSANDPFLHHPRLVATPHIGYVTEDEWDMQFTDIHEQVVAFADGVPINMINPEAWDEQSAS